jgi:hypothetical protein
MQFRSRIHERTILLRFLGIIVRVLKHEVSVHNVYITSQFQKPLLLKGGVGVKSISRDDCECKGENSEDFCPNYVQEFGLRSLGIKHKHLLYIRPL